MESTSQQQPAQPCQCQQQLGGALPSLAVALAIIVGIDRWNSRRRKNKEQRPITTAVGGMTNGDNK